jgi:hypothetical protein
MEVCLNCTCTFIRSRTNYSLSSQKKNLFKNLFNHFQYAQKAKETAKKKGINLNNLTDEQKLKLKPIIRLKNKFRIINIVLGAMVVIGFTVWYKRKKISI